MPRPCAVELHVRRYKERLAGRLRMPRPCAVEVHVRRYKERLAGNCGCHGLAPWSFTFAATKNVSRGIADATALRRGASRSRLQRTSRRGLRMPRPCAVELHVRSYKERLAGDCG